MAKSSAPINDSPTLAEKVESVARQRGFSILQKKFMGA